MCIKVSPSTLYIPRYLHASVAVWGETGQTSPPETWEGWTTRSREFNLSQSPVSLHLEKLGYFWPWRLSDTLRMKSISQGPCGSSQAEPSGRDINCEGYTSISSRPLPSSTNYKNRNKLLKESWHFFSPGRILFGVYSNTKRKLFKRKAAF